VSFTYTTLTQSIDEYTQNTNWGSTNDQTDTIIGQAEERINHAVQIANYNTKTATGDISDHGSSIAMAGSGPGVAVSNVTSPIGPIYMKIRAGETSSPTTTNAWQYLLLKDYNFLQEYAPITDDTTDGTPKYYAFYNDPGNDGLATFSFGPSASEKFEYEILYFFKPSSIIVDTSGTWLSTHGTNALLYACLVEAYTFLKGEQDLMQLYDTKYKEALQTLIMTEQGNYRTSFRDRQRAA